MRNQLPERALRTKPMAEGPIQVVLNADNYQIDRERPKGRGRESDFFAVAFIPLDAKEEWPKNVNYASFKAFVT